MLLQSDTISIELSLHMQYLPPLIYIKGDNPVMSLVTMVTGSTGECEDCDAALKEIEEVGYPPALEDGK